MKIAIVGPGRSGKGLGSRYLRDISRLRYTGSTSWHAATDVAAVLGLTPAEAYARRHEDRETWYRECNRLRQNDPAALARRTLADGDICDGVRDEGEILTIQAEGLVQLTIWISRDVAHDSTLKFGRSVADVEIDNNGTVAEFHGRLRRLANAMGVLRTT